MATIVGVVNNGVSVHIVQTVQDNGGRSWALIQRLPDNQNLDGFSAIHDLRGSYSRR